MLNCGSPAVQTRRAHGRRAVVFLFGTCPTGIRVISFIDFRSITDTEFEPALATYALRPSGVSVTQSGEIPTSTLPSRPRSGSEYAYIAVLSRLLTTNILPSGVTAI